MGPFLLLTNVSYGIRLFSYLLGERMPFELKVVFGVLLVLILVGIVRELITGEKL